MKIYQDNIKNKRNKINIKDVVYMTSQLDKFVKLYHKCIWETDDEQRQTIQSLSEIVGLLKRKQFETLFENDIDLIDFDVSNSKFEPEELKAWNEFFKRNPY